MNKSLKIGFYFNNKKYENIDFSNPQKGNPGIGGVEYMFSLVSHYCANYFETYVLTNQINHLSTKTNNIEINSLEEALNKANELELDYLVCRAFGNKEDYELLNKYKCKVIIWAHNFTKFKELNWISKNTNVVKYVCVGKEQYRLLNGHPIYSKAAYIYNGLPLDAYNRKQTNNEKAICYIGSIIKGKGFDKCCKVWRRLYDNGYKTTFNVIGSAKLYNSNKQLGKYNIATPEYENEFIEYLTDEKGNLLKEVKLYGLLGHKEKVEVINNSYIGISASQEETFGLIAIEFETLGKPFISTRTLGFVDTVNNNETGYLISNEDELYNACIKVLEINTKDYDNISNNCVEHTKQFDINNIIKEWKSLFEDISINSKEDISLTNKINNYISLIINYH